MKRFPCRLLLTAICAITLLPAVSQAGPFIYRGGPWDRWVAPVVYPAARYYQTYDYAPQPMYYYNGVVQNSNVSVSGYTPVASATTTVVSPATYTPATTYYTYPAYTYPTYTYPTYYSYPTQYYYGAPIRSFIGRGWRWR